MNRRTSNISRNLPKAPNTGNTSLNTWLSAAEEIIKELRQRMANFEGNRTSDSGSGTGQSVIKLPNLNDYERKENKVSVIDENIDGTMHYPSVAALKDYVSRFSQESDYENVFEDWEIELQTFEELDVQQGDYLRIVGNGSFGTMQLRDGDIAFVYQEEGVGLQLLVIIDSRILKKGVHTTDDLDEGNEKLYFTELRVLNTVLNNLIESIDEIEPTDSVLVAIGKAKGRINHLQALISFLENDLQQKIDAINADLDSVHDELDDHNARIIAVNVSLNEFKTATNSALSDINLELDGIQQTITELTTSLNDFKTATNTTLSEINTELEEVQLNLTDKATKIATLETDLGVVVLDLAGVSADLETAEQDIETLQTDMADRLKTSELLQALQATVPAQTGTYILKCTDGVLSWVEQP
jgi:predicted  nucleic acid-binding Zn-ribbon protein